jgi:hypothetical protein
MKNVIVPPLALALGLLSSATSAAGQQKDIDYRIWTEPFTVGGKKLSVMVENISATGRPLEVVSLTFRDCTIPVWHCGGVGHLPVRVNRGSGPKEVAELVAREAFGEVPSARISYVIRWADKGRTGAAPAAGTPPSTPSQPQRPRYTDGVYQDHSQGNAAAREAAARAEAARQYSQQQEAIRRREEVERRQQAEQQRLAGEAAQRRRAEGQARQAEQRRQAEAERQRQGQAQSARVRQWQEEQQRAETARRLAVEEQRRAEAARVSAAEQQRQAREEQARREMQQIEENRRRATSAVDQAARQAQGMIQDWAAENERKLDQQDARNRAYAAEIEARNAEKIERDRREEERYAMERTRDKERRARERELQERESALRMQAFREVVQLHAEAQRLEQVGDLAGAEAAFKELARHEPRANINLAQFYRRRGRHVEAVRSAQAYLDVADEMFLTTAERVLADELLHAGRLDEALSIYQRLLNTPGEESVAHMHQTGIAQVHLKRGQTRQALNLLEPALRQARDLLVDARKRGDYSSTIDSYASTVSEIESLISAARWRAVDNQKISEEAQRARSRRDAYRRQQQRP